MDADGKAPVPGYPLVKQAAQQFKRRQSSPAEKMLHLLHSRGPLMFTGIQKNLRIDQPVASNQLARLRKAGIIAAQREGKAVFYAINHIGLQTLHAAAAMAVNLTPSKKPKGWLYVSTGCGGILALGFNSCVLHNCLHLLPLHNLQMTPSSP